MSVFAILRKILIDVREYWMDSEGEMKGKGDLFKRGAMSQLKEQVADVDGAVRKLEPYQACTVCCQRFNQACTVVNVLIRLFHIGFCFLNVIFQAVAYLHCRTFCKMNTFLKNVRY